MRIGVHPTGGLSWSIVTCFHINSAYQLAVHGFATILVPTGVSPNNSYLGFPVILSNPL